MKLSTFLIIHRVNKIGISFSLVLPFALEISILYFILMGRVIGSVVNPFRISVILIFVQVEASFGLIVQKPSNMVELLLLLELRKVVINLLLAPEHYII